MNTPTIKTLILLTLFFTACQPRNKEVFDEAERLLDVAPDSSLYLLQQIQAPQLMPPADYANYCLLLTQANDKNYIKHTSDSLINIAVAYYSTNPKGDKPAKAYFFCGRVNDELQKPEKAQTSYLKALDLASQGNDYRFLTLIHNRIGNFYMHQGLYPKALKEQKEAQRYARLVNDDKMTYHVLRSLGVVLLLNEQPDSSIYYTNQALNLAGKMNNSEFLSGASIVLNLAYQKINSLDIALKYVNAAIEQANEPEILYTCYYNKGMIYLSHFNQPDSARYYLKESLKTQDLETRIAVIDQLSSAYEREGEYQNALFMRKLHLQYIDTLHLKLRAKVVAEIDAKYQHAKLQNENDRLYLAQKEMSLNIYRIILVSVCLIVFFIFLLYYQRRQSEKEKQEMVIAKMEKNMENIIFKQKQEELRVMLLQMISVVQKVHSFSMKTDVKELLTPDEWEVLTRAVNSCHSNFTERLRNTYPRLSADDVRFCSLIKLEVEDPYIASIFMISIDTVFKKKYRIKKEKMGITGDMDKRSLNDIIEQF